MSKAESTGYSGVTTSDTGPAAACERPSFMNLAVRDRLNVCRGYGDSGCLM